MVLLLSIQLQHSKPAAPSPDSTNDPNVVTCLPSIATSSCVYKVQTLLLC